MTSQVTRKMQELVGKSSLGAQDVLRVRRTTPSATTKKVVKASRTTSSSSHRRT